MKAGRPQKLTPELQAQVILVLQSGAYIETAAAFAGVSRQSLHQWLRRGRAQRRGKFRDFLEAVEKAIAQSDVRDLTNITTQSKRHWQASAWRLERRHPKQWGRRSIPETPKERKPTPPKVIGFKRPSAKPLEIGG